MKHKLIIVIALFIFLIPGISIGEEKVAKVIIMRGKVSAKNSRANVFSDLKMGDWVEEKATIQTEKRSIVKFLFIDKSQMTLGPEGSLVISKFPKQEAGLITLIKGQMNNKIMKNYLDDGEKKDKLYIKTKTAAMGVRGTEFQVLYNAENLKTSVITFSGEVKMAQTDHNERVSYNSLREVLNSDHAVSVRDGQFAGSSEAGRVNLPIKINPAQLNSMKQNSDLAGTNAKTKQKQYQSPIPVGVSAKNFTGSSSNTVDKSLSTSLGSRVAKEVMQQVVKEIKKSEAKNDSAPPPEGFKDENTGAFAPAAGGYVDINTGIYISPPPGSVYDENTKTYTPPPNLGGFDQATGGYAPPEGLKLDAKGVFVMDNSRLKQDLLQKAVIVPVIIEMSKAADLARNFERTLYRPIEQGGFTQENLDKFTDDKVNEMTSNDTENTTNQSSQPVVHFNITIN